MFLSKILPSTGKYCVAQLMPGQGRDWFRHYFYDDITTAHAQVQALDSAGHTAYIAQATFDPEKIDTALAYNKALPKGSPREDRLPLRPQKNALLLKAFFLDIDCGEKWPLKDQREGIISLKAFVQETCLPFPAVVNSGNGLYAYWILSEEIPAARWKTIAHILKQVVAEYSPKIGADSSRTADSASVLRVVGTHNRKPGKAVKNVSLLKDAEPIHLLEFVDCLNKAAKKKKINISATQPPKSSDDINSEFFIESENKYLPSSAEKIACKCAQLALMRDSRGDVSEPLWYACLGLLAHCENGDEVAQEWSSGHPNYDFGETEKKISQWRGTGYGPATCANLGQANGSACIGCSSNGKIKSPIVLGRPDPEQIILPDDQIDPPEGFRRSEKGLYVEQDGVWVKFYDRDLYPSRLAYDESLGYEVMTLKHSLPFEGDMTCTVRSSIVNDTKTLINILSDNHIKVVGLKEKKLMAYYLEGYQARLQRKKRMSMLLCQMGWKELRNGKPMFVVGKKIFHSDGTKEEASLARNVPNAINGYRSSGELSKWTETTKIFDRPGMEPFAFALLAGGFGAPLMKFTGFDGALVSMEGTSGAGKTLLLIMIQSIWGYHKDLMMLRDDTNNALVSRLGVYGNLPLTIDEVTNIPGMVLSDLVYRVTQGRDKARLTRNSEEKKILNTWNTLAVTSSNSPLIDKLSGAKHDASAEINRVFEYHVTGNPHFKGLTTTEIYWTLDNNYGLAGEVYSSWLIQNVNSIKKSLDTIRNKVDYAAGIKGDERFWSAVVSVALFGGSVAKKLGLIDFDLGPVSRWAIEHVKSMRNTKVELSDDPVGVLGQFLDENATARLVVKDTKGGGPMGCTVLETPRHDLAIRQEMDTRTLYISRETFRKWLAKKHGSYSTIRKTLEELGILKSHNRRKVLGAGTQLAGAQQYCWEINMDNQHLRGL